MSLGEYLLGAGQLIVLVVLAAYVAGRLRATLMAGWTGSPARLVESVTAVGLVVLSAELLGLFGLLRSWTLLVVLAAAAAAARTGLRRPIEGGSAPPNPRLPGGSWPWLIGLGVTFLLVAQWGAFVAQNLDHGITNFDSVWYHLPYAAEIARTGSVTFFPHTETVFTNWFYPQNSELIHGVGMAAFGYDYLSLFLNLGWLGMALLAGWCVGRPYGRPQVTLIAAAIVLATHTLVVREPGTAKNDVMAIALILAALAILINRGAAATDGQGRVGPGWALAAAGLAAGLAAGTKVTALAPVAMMTVAVLAASLPGTRLRSFGVWIAAMAFGGGWWYLRNLFATGNPLPQLRQLGPIDLPGPERLQEGRPDFTVLHYITDSTVWREYFIPGLGQGLGRAWPLLILIAVAGLIVLTRRGPGRLSRAHGAATLAALAAYLVTPLSAAGAEGHPTAFSINLRFIAPALAMSLVLVPLVPWLDPGRKSRPFITGLFLMIFLVTWAAHPLTSTTGSLFGIGLALLIVVVPALAWWFRGRQPRWRAAARRNPVGLAVVVCAGLFLIAAWPLSQRYYENRYTGFAPEAAMTSAYDWANQTAGQRIGLAGTAAGFKAFGFYGPDLSNRVIYLGLPGAKGSFNAIGDCRAFVKQVNAARLDYLVTSPFLNFLQPEESLGSPEGGWIENDPALTMVESEGPVTVWKVGGELDPGTCGSSGPGQEIIPGRVRDHF